jgi:hypothetical protein
MNKISSFFTYNARRFGHYRFEEPVLVFESDDWGKVAGREDGIYPPEFGTRTDWSFDRLETEEELDQLYTLLESFKDDFERKPVFTANFIVSNPDFKRTSDKGFQALHLKAIDEAFPNLHKKWLKGLSRGVFYPQYHGRLHYNNERYVQALQTDDATRFLFEQGINGGRENFSETQQALYSEYFRADTELRVSSLKEWIRGGLDDFERVFGYRSASTVPPNYYIHPADFETLANCGLRYLQAGNKVLYTQNGAEHAVNYCQGTQFNESLTILARNHKFEPNRGRQEWKAEFSIKAAKHWFRIGAPAVIDTHRFNYVSTFAQHSRNELKIFLEGMRDVPNLHILTTLELGQAITNNGNYTDVFTGEQKELTPRDNFLRKIVRARIS